MSVRNPQLRQLRGHRVPAWWSDAKLGIMVHWTPASVPAFAPTDADMGELLASGGPDALARAPYAEWYENSLRFPDSPVARHHQEVYGARPYAAFAADWEAGLAGWDPDEWVARFAATGARYVVFVAKHADGYCLWPTAVANPRRPGWNCRRDVVGEMAEAVRGAGMRFGIYYCGGLDWTFDDRPIGSLSETIDAIPRGTYADYAEAHVRELIDRYRPSVLWNDVAWPAPGPRLWPLFRHYYEQVPDGVVNDRWMPRSALLGLTRVAAVRRAIDAGARREAARHGGIVPPVPPHADFRTPEYVVFPEVRPEPWECVRGMDRSFGYNAQSRPEDFVARDDLLWSFVDIVAKGGNLLLNVGPRGVDAQIPREQVARLDWLGDWVPPHRRALAGSRPWVTADATSAEGRAVRYTARDDAVFAFVREGSGPVTFADVAATPTTSVASVPGADLPWRDSPAGLVVEPAAPGDRGPTVVVLRQVTARQPERRTYRSGPGERAGASGLTEVRP